MRRTPSDRTNPFLLPAAILAFAGIWHIVERCIAGAVQATTLGAVSW